MGTNYYWEPIGNCPSCGQPLQESLHIGKASAGWTFSFRAHFDDLLSYADWLEKLPLGNIRDEYRKYVSLSEFKEIVSNHQLWKGEPALSHARLALYSFDKTIPLNQLEKDYVQQHPTDFSCWNKCGAREDYWLDKEGHSFQVGEFS